MIYPLTFFFVTCTSVCYGRDLNADAASKNQHWETRPLRAVRFVFLRNRRLSSEPGEGDTVTAATDRVRTRPLQDAGCFLSLFLPALLKGCWML